MRPLSNSAGLSRIDFGGSQLKLLASIVFAAVLGTIGAAFGQSSQSTATATDSEQVSSIYKWSAQLTAAGEFSFSGMIPAPQLQRYLHVRAKNIAMDTTAVSSIEAPEGFVQDVLAGFSALQTLKEGTVRFDGSSWAIEGSGSQASVTSALASAYTAMEKWSVSVTAPDMATVPEGNEQQTMAAAVEEPKPPIRYHFDARKTVDEGQIRLFGVVPAEATRQYYRVISENGDISNLYTYEGAPSGFLEGGADGLRALTSLERGKLVHEFGKWTLTGDARDDSRRDQIMASLQTFIEDGGWSVQIELIPPIELCRLHVADLAAENAILFSPGSSRLTDESHAVIDRFAEFLDECPDSEVEVEGHTDSDGPNDENLGLSVARAEAVIGDLVAKGVRPERLYAVGYGETLPIASNENEAGKRRNRRIAFKIIEADKTPGDP